MSLDRCPTCGSSDRAYWDHSEAERRSGKYGCADPWHDTPTEADDLPARLVDARTSGGVTAIELRDARIRELEAENATLKATLMDELRTSGAEVARLTALGDALADAATRAEDALDVVDRNLDAALDAWRNR